MYEVWLGGRRCTPHLALVSADMLKSALSLLVCSDLVSERDTGLCWASNECSSAGPSAPTRTRSPLATMMCADEGDWCRKASASGTICMLQPESTAMLDHRQPAGAGANSALAALLLTKGWFICIEINQSKYRQCWFW